MFDGLANQDAIKRILVVVRQLGQKKGGILADRQGADKMLFPLFRDEFFRCYRQGKFAQRPLYTDFPGRGGTQINIVIGITEKVAGGWGEMVATGNQPEEGTGVKQQVHGSSPLKAAIISGGNGSKNSLGTVKPG